jgi:hypothetical protein
VRDDRALEALLAARTPEQARSVAVADWPALLERAARHGIDAVLLDRLDAFHVAPPETLARARDHRALVATEQAALGAILDEILLTLERAHVKAVALKGPLLGERLYGAATDRRSSDLDLLVDPEDLARAETALAAIGYRTQAGPHLDYDRAHQHSIDLTRESSPLLELHFRLYQGFGVTLDAQEFLGRALRYEKAWILSPEDELLHLAVHACGHAFERLAWLLDVALLLEKRPIHMGVLRERARRLGVLVAVVYALETLEARLGVPFPAALPRRSGPRRRAATLLLHWNEDVPPGTPRGTVGRLVYVAALCDRTGPALRYLGHHLGRIGRRRASRWLPGLTPAGWQG